jgi:hypothetical protein
MVSKPTLFAFIIALVLLFPEEMLSLLRRMRRWLEDDIRRRVRAGVSDEEWRSLSAELDREFAD